MGAYLSEPVTEKISSDEADGRVECGASSMQGWRVNQEVLFHSPALSFSNINYNILAPKCAFGHVY